MSGFHFVRVTEQAAMIDEMNPSVRAIVYEYGYNVVASLKAMGTPDHELPEKCAAWRKYRQEDFFEEALEPF